EFYTAYTPQQNEIAERKHRHLLLPSSALNEKSPYETDYVTEKNDTSNVFQDINHVKFFDIEYPEIPNDDERVDPKQNSDQRSQSNISNSFVPGEGVNTAAFLVNNSGNDADSSEDIFSTQYEEVATLDENVFSKGNLDQNPTTSAQGIQSVIRSSGEIDRYKARLVAQGFGQKEGIDYEETFSPIVKMVTVRCLLNVVITNSWHVFPLDVNNAFLYGDLLETVYMKPPEGYFPSGNKVQSKSDYSLYTKSDKGVFLALFVYVDDIIITGLRFVGIKSLLDAVGITAVLLEVTTARLMLLVYKLLLLVFRVNAAGTKLQLLKEFKIHSSGINKVIDTNKGICLNQRKYVLDLLSDYGMLACKPAKTPLMSKLNISNEATKNDPILNNIIGYQKLMGKLIYLTNTRPDISYVVHCLSHFMHSPLRSHLKIAFKMLRYLKSCPGLGIHIIKDSEGIFHQLHRRAPANFLSLVLLYLKSMESLELELDLEVVGLLHLSRLSLLLLL
ncbi:ribonuclease H-like domain-containing protein, partial [Tanacetum coccineum]